MTISRKFFFLTLALIFLSSTACSRSQQARYLDNEGSGFLKNYSQLKPNDGNKEDRALLIYDNPSANWKKYDRIMIDPIVMHASEESELGSIEAKDRQILVNYFSVALHRELAKVYKVTKSAGPSTLRVRVAITDAESSNRLSDTTSTILPYTLALSALKEVAVGRPIGVGDVQVEGEALDSVTGERLTAGIDRRVGGKALEGKFDEWDDVKNSFDYWAQAIRKNMLKRKRSATAS